MEVFVVWFAYCIATGIISFSSCNFYFWILFYIHWNPSLYTIYHIVHIRRCAMCKYIVFQNQFSKAIKVARCLWIYKESLFVGCSPFWQSVCSNLYSWILINRKVHWSYIYKSVSIPLIIIICKACSNIIEQYTFYIGTCI